MRILLVDDDEALRSAVRSLLLACPGLSVCGEASDGIEAIEKAKELRPDTVLMDVVMPRMDGLQATRAIRRQLPQTRVIIVSQNDPALLRIQAAEVQAQDYIAKSDLAMKLIPVIEGVAKSGTAADGANGCASKSAAASVFPWVQGGGEMGAAMRAADWPNTPLGALETWSPALRMMVKFLLANRFPQLLWWGPQFCSLYNDAYIPILGAKHPWALGRPVSEVWGEIWHVLKPLIEIPFQGGPATWMEDISLEINRRGFVEETHFTIAYSPVPDETVESGIGGVLATVHEITEKVVGERRVLALSDLGLRSVEPKSAEEACAFAAETLARHPKDVPFVLFYLFDSGQRTARLVCRAGVDAENSGCPSKIELDSRQPSDLWPVSRILETEQIELVPDLNCKLRSVPQGPWSSAPTTAAAVPIRSHVAHQLAGFMIVGLSSRLQFDEKYRGFLELMSTQIATTVAGARAYEEERRRAEALAEIDRAKTAFFSNVSHEFRTPLTLMLGPLHDLLENYSALSPDAKERIDLINRNAARLLRLVNTLLDFSRIEAGRVQAAYEPTDLASLTADLASVFRSATERGGLRLVIDCPPLDERVYVDRDMWEKIVLNLISNAFKFTFHGEIAVSLARQGDALELRVRDTGVGIPPEELPKIFERFHRIPNTRSRTYEGSGIGLALVHELVKLHGGSLRVESILGQGSTFIVRVPFGKAHLPAAQVGAARAVPPTAVGAMPFLEEALRWVPDVKHPDAKNPEGMKNASSLDELPPLLSGPPADPAARPRVIVADDNSDMRQYLHRLLAGRYEVELAPDGAAALNAARRIPPDLILSDAMMPGLDGLGLVRELRSDPVLREIPVILLSARAGEESRAEGMQSGADDYLVKPFSARELFARVEAHARMHRMRQQARLEQQRLIAQAEAEVRARTTELENRNVEVLRQAELLRDFSQRLLQAQDGERRRIARELHDSSGQILTVLGMNLAKISRLAKKKVPALASDAEESAELVRQLSREIRTMSYLLHPPLLDETGVAEALQWYVNGFTARSGIDIRLEMDSGFGRFPSEIELAIFRIVQEALTNIHRHSGSKRGVIRISRGETDVSIEIQDFGKGISSEKLNEIRSGAAGVGFRGMRERVHQLRGQTNVQSDGTGTKLLVVFPVAKASPAPRAAAQSN